jgi:hypothetical protein
MAARNRGAHLAMNPEPMKALERHVPVHPLKYIEGATDGLFVGGV